MKNDQHLAFKTTFNFPLQISIYDSVEAHLNDEIRLITMLPSEWPKLRARELKRSNFTVDNIYKLANHTVEHIRFSTREMAGVLVDGKYFLSDGILSVSCDLELMLTPFDVLGVKPMACRDWSGDYMGAFPMYYALVENGDTKSQYFPIADYEVHGIDNLLDLMAYSYKFIWDEEFKMWTATTERKLIAERIRKPWMQYLTQWRFGESPATEADTGKLISFLLSKVELSAEEKQAVRPYIDRAVDLPTLSRIGARQHILNELLAAYHADTELDVGTDIKTDPFFSIAISYAKE